MSDQEFLNDLIELRKIILNKPRITKETNTKYAIILDADGNETNRKILESSEKTITHNLGKKEINDLIYLNKEIDKLRKKIEQV